MSSKLYITTRPKVLNRLIKLEFSIADTAPYISWEYFYYAWQLTTRNRKTPAGAMQDQKLRKDADKILRKWELDKNIPLKCHILLTQAKGVGEDIILPTLDTYLPMLRQQTKKKSDFEHNKFLCLSDFIEKEDYIGLFGCTMIRDLSEYDKDPYKQILAQTLADRLAEAATEHMHEIIRKKYWGYAQEENLPLKDLLIEKYDGIRPAIGYPCMPDTSINFIISKLINFDKLGIKLTENGAMLPHASVSGLIIANPESKYFNVGKIGEDQLTDYALRCNVSVEKIRPFLAANLI